MARRFLQIGLGLFLGLVVVLLLLPLVTRDEAPDDPHVLPAPYPAPSIDLTDEHGDPRRIPGDFEGVTAVFFGYTHCPDVCPITMASLAAVRDRLEPSEAERFRVVLVSVDPARDTPELLRDYLARFDSTFVGLTGSEEEVREVARAWGAWAERAATPPVPGDSAVVPGPDEGYLVDHTARTFLVGPRRRIVATFPASTAAEAMLPTVRRLLEETD